MSSLALKIPIFRIGNSEKYHSAETTPIRGIDGSSLGDVSVSLPARIKFDAEEHNVTPWLHAVRERGLGNILESLVKAAGIFRNGELETGGRILNPEEYCHLQSLATGVPEHLCSHNMDKVQRALLGTEQTLRGHLNSWRGDISLEDIFMGKEGPGYARQSALLGGIWPSNSSGVYQLLPPGLALGPVLIKPGSGDVFTPYRIREACRQADFPVEAIGIYPGYGTQLSKAIKLVASRRLMFGGAETVAKFEGDPQVEVHGPGCSKIVIGPDMVDRWEQYLDVIVESVMNGSGRGCIACSAVYAPGDIAFKLADALSTRISATPVKKMDDPDAMLAAFGSPDGAQKMLDLMGQYVKHGEGWFMAPESDTNRAVNCGTYSVLRPLVAYLPKVPPPGKLSASRFEIPAPAVLVVNTNGAKVEEVIGSTLVCTAITEDAELLGRLADSSRISRLNRNPIPTTKIHVEGEVPRPLEGLGMPRFLFDENLGKKKDTF